MTYEKQIQQLHRHHSVHLQNMVNPDLCKEIISRIENHGQSNDLDALLTQAIETLTPALFSQNTLAFLEQFYLEEYEYRWPIFDIVDDQALVNYISTTWHCDGGPEKMLKLFLYLNPVDEHSCNTIFIDAQRTKSLKKAGALPLELDQRLLDVSNFLKKVGVSTQTTAYNLAAGDIMVFNPTLLAHRCVPPKPGKKRYTICYSIYPRSFFNS